MDLKGKTAIVTGASSGIGEATAVSLADLGVKVALVARRKDRLDELAKKIQKNNGECLVIEADVTQKEIAKKVIEQVVKEFGQIDILINNAGVMLLGPVHNAPLEEWERMVHVNLLGLLYMTHAVLPEFKKQGSGHLINVSSVAGRKATMNSAVYNATKWGVNAFTEALRQELVNDKANVRTTLIEPGAVATELVSHNRDEIQESINQRFKGIEKKLESEDIAASIVYAVSQPDHVAVNEILIRPTTQPM